MLAFIRGALISTLLALALLALLELVLALLGVQPVLYGEDPYVGFASYIPLFVEQEGPGGRPWMATPENKRNLFNAQSFPVAKSPGTHRIFCLGGSTTYGRPYDDSTSFCGWLRAMLPQAAPSCSWEVINAGGISYASYRVARLMEELVAYEPDLFIIYTGQNEFLEERTYRDLAHTPPTVRNLGAVLARTRLFTVTRKIRTTVSHSDGDDRPQLEDEVNAILDNSVGPEAYYRDDELRARVLEHFRFNLVRIVNMVRSAGARVILVTPASSLRDCAPFKSEHQTDLTADERSRCQQAHAAARQAMEARNWSEALSNLDAALVLDDRHAERHYLRGRVLWNQNRHEEAKAAFIRARDEDICPLRALTPMRSIIEDVAAQQGVPLVDFAAWTESHSPHGVPGAELFLDHVHPTIETHGRLALSILETMRDEGIVEFADTWDGAAFASVRETIESRLDPVTQAAALLNLAKVTGWAGKFQEACRLARRAARMNPRGAEAYYLLAENAAQLGHIEEAISAYREALRVRPGYPQAHLKLGNALSGQGRSQEAIEHYQRAAESSQGIAHLAHNNLGNEFSAIGQPEEAVRHYREAIRLRPGYAEAHSNLGLALMALGHSNEAIAHYREAVALDPGFHAARYNLGLALATHGEHKEALGHLRLVAQGMPDYAPGRYHLGEALAATGQRTEALEHYREALRLQPNYAAAREALARPSEQSGKRTEPRE